MPFHDMPPQRHTPPMAPFASKTIGFSKRSRQVFADVIPVGAPPMIATVGRGMLATTRDAQLMSSIALAWRANDINYVVVF